MKSEQGFAGLGSRDWVKLLFTSCPPQFIRDPREAVQSYLQGKETAEKSNRCLDF